MSDREQSPRPAGRTDQQRPGKPDRRAAAQAVRASQAAAKARRQRLAGALAGALLFVAGGAALVLLPGRSGDTVDPLAAPSAPATTPAAADPAGATPGAGLPEGANPALASKPVVRAAGAGKPAKLTVTPLIEGKGSAAQSGQQITVNYVGVLYQTGEEFDASWTASRPFSFPLGAGRVIPGWDQGLVGIKVGSRVQLDIPAALAYGEQPQPGYPAGPLRFVVDVLAVG